MGDSGLRGKLVRETGMGEVLSHLMVSVQQEHHVDTDWHHDTHEHGISEEQQDGVESGRKCVLVGKGTRSKLLPLGPTS